MRRVVFIILGLLTLLLGLGMLAAAVGIFVTFGTDGRFESRQGSVKEDAAALASEPAEISGTAPLRLGVGTLSVTASSQDANRQVFLGVGRTTDVDAYLAGTSYRVIGSIDGDPLEVVTSPNPAPGDRAPANPVDQTFWVVKATGPGEQRLDFDIQSGDYRFVMMHVDGGAPVSMTAQLGVLLPWIFPVGVVLAVLGSVVLLIAIALFSASKPVPRFTMPTLPPPGPLPTPLGGAKGPTP